MTLKRGRLEIRWPGLASTGPLLPRVLLTDGQELVGKGWRRAGDRFQGDCGPVRVEIGAMATDGQVHLEVRAQATGRADVAEVGFACRPAICGLAPEWVVYNGYQSWDAAGTIAAGQPDGEPVKRQSWWTCGLADGTGSGIAIGATAALRATTRFDLKDGVFVATGSEPSGLIRYPLLWRARPGGPAWEADPLLMTAGPDLRQALSAVASAVRGIQVPRPPQGWLSWYHHGPWIGRDELLRNADELARGRLSGLGYRYVQLDDGWQEAYGDWHPNHKFRAGIADLATELAERGHVLGIWTAPFLVSAASHLARTAPEDWFVKDPVTGERAVDPVHLVFGPMNILDARRPAVRKHLEDLFSGLYEAGVRYFKIDFLYAGGYAGTKALRQGVRAIRRGVKDSYLLACGAPLLPMVGLADGCRIGRDTATPLFDFEHGAPKPTLLDDEITEVGRNQAARHFLRSWFQLDPDVALVGGNLSLEQARTCVTICALSGGPFFASDDLDALPPERLAMLANPEVLALIGGEPAIPDWEPRADDRPAAVWRKDGAVAVFNWEGADRTVTIDLNGRSATDLWSGEEVPLENGFVTLEVPASGVRLLRVEQG